MLDFLQRWLTPPPEPAKAATGPAVYSMSTFPQLTSIANRPEKRIAELQALFRNNPWVAQAERAVYGRYLQTAWHLEDSAGNTVDRKAAGPASAVMDLIEQPNPRMRRRKLWGLTLRHQGLCGNAFWYLDQRTLFGGAPLAVLYINPARMTPAESDNGTLLGWIMDHPQNPNTRRGMSPVPFELDEIRQFTLDEPDDGHYGIGWAEAAWQNIQLDSLASRHVSGVLAAGGRLAGLISPKTGVTISDDQWQQLVRDWRSVTSDPESAKRLLIARGPVDLADTTANLKELEMVELLKLSREDVFAALGVNISVGAGINTATGLNSGESRKYDEAALWQGPIEFRVGSFEEQVQSIVDLFGLGLRLVVEHPAFDDQAPLFANAEKATKQPLTNNERRALLGFDPLEDDELGEAIFIEKEMVPLSVEPPVPPVPFAAAQPPALEEESESGLGEASQPVKAALRDGIERTWTPRLRDAVAGFLAEQATSIANRVRNNHRHIVAKPSDVRAWWSERWDGELTALLTPLLADMATEVSTAAARPLGKAKADAWIEQVLAIVRRGAATRIAGINRTTRDAVARLVAAGIEQGLSPAALADTIREATTFDAARADLISRTETATAYNEAALGTYRAFEVEMVEAIDGDEDAECAARNGKRYPIDEAMGISDHPNGTLDWLPVT